MKPFLCLFFVLLLNSGIAQDTFFEDSLLWSSPVSASAVRSNHIKKLIVNESGWKKECKHCPDHPEPSMFKTVYYKNEATFEYDTLGFPTWIMQYDRVRKCTNNYNSLGQLVEAEIFYEDEKGNWISSFRNAREYNAQGLLSRSTMYSRDALFKINEYSYNDSGRIMEINDKRNNFSWKRGTNFETYMILKFEYDSLNRLCKRSELTPYGDLVEGSNKRIAQFYYDKTNKDSLTVYLLNGDTTSASAWSAVSPKIKSLVVYWHNGVKELRLLHEITDEQVCFWNFVYGKKGAWPAFRAYDLKSGLIMTEKKEKLKQNRIKSVRSQGVIRPKKDLRYKFSNKATIITYSYTYWR